MLQSSPMRKNIGWQEQREDGKHQIRVRFEGGGRIRFQHITKSMERWESFDPAPEHWHLLLEKTQARYVRRQAPYKDLLLIQRLAAQHPLPPEP